MDIDNEDKVDNYLDNKEAVPRCYECVVVKVIYGAKGTYAVTRCEEIQGSITFSCVIPTWNENRMPQIGENVLVYELFNNKKGWRSNKVEVKNPLSSEKELPLKQNTTFEESATKAQETTHEKIISTSNDTENYKPSKAKQWIAKKIKNCCDRVLEG